MPKRSTFLDTFKGNFDTLKHAFKQDDVAMVECFDAKAKRKVAVLAAVNRPTAEDPTYHIVPFAKLLSVKELDTLCPPSAGGKKKFGSPGYTR